MALADALHGLLRLPGATYACIVERDGGRVLAEAGRGEGGAGDGEGVVPYSVAGWGTAVAAMFDTTSGDELDDVMITGRRSYHLVRPLGPGAAVLVYLRLDRARSTLAAARRELAAVRWGAVDGSAPGGSRALRPVPEPRPEPASRPVPGSRAGGAGPAAPPTPPARRAPTPPPTPPTTTNPPPPAPRAGTLARVPAALPPSASSRGRATVAAAGARSRSGPASAGSGPRIPLPRRAPAPRPADESRRRAALHAAGDPGEGAAVPEGFTMPTVLGQSWARDPGTLRRLIAGLRRLT